MTQNLTVGGRRVTVVGGGVVGLTAAVRLLEGGNSVRIVAARAGAASVSGVAPALFTPYPGAPHARLMGWVRESLSSLRELAEHAPESGVHVAPVRLYRYSDPEGSEEAWESLLSRRDLPAPAGVKSVDETLRPHIDMTRYLPWLESRVRELGGEFEAREVTSLSGELSAGAGTVVNCTGLGARRLVSDNAMTPLRGIVARIPNAIGLTRSVHDDAPGGHVTYVFVYRDHLAVGSTFEPGRWEEEIDTKAVEAMFDRARNLLRLDGFARWSDLSNEGARLRVGLRPARAANGTYEDIRLEREETPAGVVVHNYGHGRSGVSLSWGCAAEAASLIGGARGLPNNPA